MKQSWTTLRRLGAFALSGACIAAAVSADAADPVAVAIAEFDYADTSGEIKGQRDAHAARLQDFARLIREELSASGKYQVVALACPQPRCSAGAMDPASLTDAARRSGARLLLYGGIHKMSTLVQFGKAQIVDLETDRVVFDRTITFRGDNDEAWKRAGEFVAEQLAAADLAH